LNQETIEHIKRMENAERRPLVERLPRWSYDWVMKSKMRRSEWRVNEEGEYID